MRTSLVVLCLAVTSLGAAPPRAAAQAPDVTSTLRWRSIGPVRAGRARALSGVPSRPNVFYVGFDNGGVWRSTDYGSNWEPLFDGESTGSIGAIAVAPSAPDVVYVGSGAGIIRPDLATGDGMYKSTDGGRTWTHLGLRESQMIADIDVDTTNPDRLFVAVLGHPYGPSTERGIFRSTDGGRTFERVLYKDEYTSGNEVRIDPSNPQVVYAALWQQQEAFWEGGSFGGDSGGLFKSTDGGTTWRPLTEGLPRVVQANIAIAPSDTRLLYALVAAAAAPGSPGQVGFYKSSDAGEHWLVSSAPGGAGSARTPDPRPLRRIGGGDLPTLAVDPKDPNVVYSASVVMWRTEDGGLTWSAVRGAPGGDDYQKIWINPDHPEILLVVTDQGAVVSANRGASWSNWYNQPTAAMFHVTADNAFPYRVCGGQQDSGSACVASRSMDGRITFHDWHPVNIQEYGIAAPDPRDPDLVFGSMRTNVSRYDRRTGQTTYVGPDAAARNEDGGAFNRNVRTMPLHWSPADPDVLFYTSNVVWKSLDHARTWTRISPDLARQTWPVPASAGKYAASVTPAPRGAITALAPSPRDVGVIWAGTDDGVIQVTTDGGQTWTDVTPAAVRPWTRIFNMEAGHFDVRTAYAAANTLRIDDPNPHFFRTRDGGKTWTEIDEGLAPGAVANSIREDPRQAGLLYASTDTQVWVSFDDGDHWQSLRLNMPAVSVRDIRIKDDDTCLCSDLIAGTHGRGFWILDDVTPLRQHAAARAARAAGAPYLFAPATAVRVRFATNDPTPWPPELPAGDNPPAGAVIDYALPIAAAGPVTLDILDGTGAVVRTYSSDDPVLDPDPALDPATYNKVCQQAPTATHCGVPLYWPAPQSRLSTAAGMHRVTWDMRYQPVGTEDIRNAGDVAATGAVPGRSALPARAPWAPPGTYSVRLTASGRVLTQPLTLRLDPRVTTPPGDLARLAALSREMYDGAVAASEAFAQARALVGALEGLEGPDAAAFKAQVEALAPPPPAGPRPPFRRARTGPPTLESVATALLDAAMAMQGADVAPTGAQEAACGRARQQAAEVMPRWDALRTNGLRAFNEARKAAGSPPVELPR